MIAALYALLAVIAIATVVVVIAMALPKDRLPSALRRVRAVAERPDHWVARPGVSAGIVGAVVILAAVMNVVHHHRSAWDWILFGLVPLVVGAMWLVRRVRT